MIEKLKNYPELRQSLGIAGGVFAGLLSYRLTIWAYKWWQESDDNTQTGVVFGAVYLVCLYVLFRILRNVFRKRSTKKQTLLSTVGYIRALDGGLGGFYLRHRPSLKAAFASAVCGTVSLWLLFVIHVALTGAR